MYFLSIVTNHNPMGFSLMQNHYQKLPNIEMYEGLISNKPCIANFHNNKLLKSIIAKFNAKKFKGIFKEETSKIEYTHVTHT